MPLSFAHRRTVVLCAALLSCATAPADAQDHDPPQPPSANATAADLLVARPGGLAATLLGSVVFVVGLPFTLINGSTEQAAQQLIVAPAQYTFNRPLGENSANP